MAKQIETSAPSFIEFRSIASEPAPAATAVKSPRKARTIELVSLLCATSLIGK